MFLRPATEADLPYIEASAHRIWRAHYTDLIGAAQVDYMLQLLYTPDSLRRQMAEGQQFWIVEDEGAARGYLSVSDKGEGAYFLHKFYLDNQQRGKGIGTQAFAALLETYPDLKELRLTVNRQNFKSINFYFKIGFTIEQCVDIPIGEGFVMDDFQMVYKTNGLQGSRVTRLQGCA